MDKESTLRLHFAETVDVSDLAFLVLRVVAGSFIVYHGLQQVVRMQDFVRVVSETGFPFPVAGAWLTMLGELGLGVLVILGLFVRPAGALLAVMFLMVFYTYYAQRFGTTMTLTNAGTLEGVESLSYGFTGIMLALVGAGPISIDALLERLALRRGGIPLPLRRLLHTEAATGQPVGRSLFTVFIGLLALYHAVSQFVSPRSSLKILGSKFDAIDFPAPNRSGVGIDNCPPLGRRIAGSGCRQQNGGRAPGDRGADCLSRRAGSWWPRTKRRSRAGNRLPRRGIRLPGCRRPATRHRPGKPMAPVAAAVACRQERAPRGQLTDNRQLMNSGLLDRPVCRMEPELGG